MSELWQRFNEMQAAIPHVRKDAVANTGAYSYKYVTLGSILEVVQPVVRDHGFVLRGTTSPGEVRYDIVDCESAATVSSASVEIPTGTSDMQRLGSAITYARRYALTVLLDIAADDDDGVRDSEDAYAKLKPSRPHEPTLKQVVFDAANQDKDVAAAWWMELATEYDMTEISRPELMRWLTMKASKQ